LSESFYILNLSVLHDLRPFLVVVDIVSRVHGGLIAMMFWTGLGWNRWTKPFTIVHKYFMYTSVQFLFTKHAYDEHLCNSVPCIGENWW